LHNFFFKSKTHFAGQ